MKKIIFYAVLTLTFLACSNSDDTSPNSKDDIVGNWKLTHHNAFGLIINNTPCHQKTFINYNDDFTADRENHVPTQTGACILQASGNGSWEKTGEDLYTFTDTATGNVIEEKIVFIDENTMYIDYPLIEFHFAKVN